MVELGPSIFYFHKTPFCKKKNRFTTKFTFGTRFCILLTNTALSPSPIHEKVHAHICIQESGTPHSPFAESSRVTLYDARVSLEDLGVFWPGVFEF